MASNSRSNSSRQQELLARLSRLHITTFKPGEAIMAILHYFKDLHCPNCNRTSNFQLLQSSPLTERRPIGGERFKWVSSTKIFRGLFICSDCNHPLTMDICSRENGPSPVKSANEIYAFLNRLKLASVDSTTPSCFRVTIDMDNLGHDLDVYFTIIKKHPDASDDIPGDLPESIHYHYVEYILGASSSALIVMGCRCTLEAVCKDKTGSDGKLVNLINKMAETGVIPEALKQWAHTIRIFGNDAVHDSSKIVSHEEAMEVRNITRLLLEFIYSFPARIERMRQSKK
ncbi:DUF4145 domain-containing protein [Salmonella enterica subsp. diarizonae]|nr:DUF4145 domain-containing protein [Salmonella enterica]EBK1959160.1 DUF4145 domain-containing protein [Salmonella enterica subsp. enterica serovar Newport]EDV2647898.1 DUF4145 domain-containing protein [Salmonella enterica subsp. diarizonae]EBG7270698.1 DUF4145 domain-containing protein [Salmonella enterica]EBP1500846.1 DUF4145 domain-containing protein [Salmonella enterica]